MKNWLKIGQATKAHGIKGEVIFHLFNEDESCLDYINEICLKPLNSNSSLPKDGKIFNIEKIRMGNKILVQFSEIQGRNELEEILPFEIYVDEKLLKEVEEGEFYLKDIIGLDAFDFQTGEKKGVIDSFYSNGAQDIIVIRGDRKKWEIPLVDSFFKEIDLENKKVLILFPQFIE
ncbi:MAG: ribosome maturation factor RimM [Bdellovibrionales bacterium]|jgi:16S rRNA processing protein RimM|nr:ribosome maturation factor RimM [Bdellovibrionales bacterium]